MEAKRGRSPQVQRPMILDVLPADVAPRLDKLPKRFNKKLISHVPKVLRQWWAAAAGVVLVLGVVLAFWQPWQPSPLPHSVASEIHDFVPYLFRGALPSGFVFDDKNMTYNEGVLFLQAKNQKGESVVVSEQALPAGFNSDSTRPDQIVVGIPSGSASLSNRDGRMIGTIITSSKPATLILLNAQNSVSADTMERLMQALAAS